MFGALYFSQGTILSYFTALNAIYFLSKGLTMTDVGIFAFIALIPFVIKIFLGMLSDKVNLLGLGHRKPYILLGLSARIPDCRLTLYPGVGHGALEFRKKEFERDLVAFLKAGDTRTLR